MYVSIEWLQLRICRLLHITDSTRITLKTLILLLNLLLQLKEPTFVSEAIILCSSEPRRARSASTLSQRFKCCIFQILPSDLSLTLKQDTFFVLLKRFQ
ncbi:unnamed protein product [Thlaspi arvense]|uniref:Uncharacterized protein n=1 Tax=Thlaspi arvense TaxID=13288 RepID=A0AAU9SHP4_THLAR|nr:unnamed protein product [Thlaspi arvense]